MEELGVGYNNFCLRCPGTLGNHDVTKFSQMECIHFWRVICFFGGVSVHKTFRLNGLLWVIFFGGTRPRMEFFLPPKKSHGFSFPPPLDAREFSLKYFFEIHLQSYQAPFFGRGQWLLPTEWLQAILGMQCVDRRLHSFISPPIFYVWCLHCQIRLLQQLLLMVLFMPGVLDQLQSLASWLKRRWL